VILIVLGSGLSFHHLGAGALLGDEAAFAYTTDHMVRSGDWIVPRISERVPHLNAAPLFNWLSTITAPLFDQGNLRYRFWAALFAVGVALATLVLGTLLFRPEVGFLAGLLLLTNYQFIFAHCAREGVMEPGLMFFVTLAVIGYVRSIQSESRSGLWWLLTGAAIGGAILMKPPVMGGSFFCMLCFHHVISSRGVPLLQRLRGPLLAAISLIVVAAPWYLALLARLGPDSLYNMFIYNSVHRAAHDPAGHRPAWSYFQWVWEASRGFKMVWPAMLWGMMCVLRGRERLAWGLPVLLAGCYTLLVSSAATKHCHYLYSAYPLFSILAAAFLLTGLNPPFAMSPRYERAWGVIGVLGIVLALAFIKHDFRMIRTDLQTQRREYAPLLIHDAMAADLAADKARLILVGYPDSDTPVPDGCGFTNRDGYYRQFRLPLALFVPTTDDMLQLISDGKPAVVFLPRMSDDELARIPFPVPPYRCMVVDNRRGAYRVLTFHDAQRRLSLEASLREIGKEAEK
jgi:4-amino-4-deoxy-L-arabinose transferase-like glycosyltransferase